MSLAAAARAAVHERPFLLEALRAGVVNYSAAARAIDVGDDEEAVATALRRYAEQLPDSEMAARTATVRMRSDLGATDEDDALLALDGRGYAPGAGDMAGIQATGEVDPAALGHVLGRLAAAGVDPEAAGVGAGVLCVVVARRDGPRTLQVVEAALEAVPEATV